VLNDHLAGQTEQLPQRGRDYAPNRKDLSQTLCRFAGATAHP
jgi:hypothetical protein